MVCPVTMVEKNLHVCYIKVHLSYVQCYSLVCPIKQQDQNHYIRQCKLIAPPELKSLMQFEASTQTPNLHMIMIKYEKKYKNGYRKLYIPVQSESWTFRVSHILSEIDDSTLVAMATKSENASITNAFGPGATPMQYEPV